MKPNYKSWEVDYGLFYRLESLNDQLIFLLKFAILAPSSHNSQPWKFLVKDGAITVMPELKRTLAVSDVHQRHLHIALGCAIENICVAADYYGLGPSVTYFPDGEPGIIGRISFSRPVFKEKKDPCHLIFSIPRRRMNRARYENQMPENALLERFRNFSNDNLEINIITDQKNKENIADILIASRIKAFSRSDFRKELFNYKRTNFTSSFLGMPGFTMGFNDVISFIAPFAIRYLNVIKIFKNSELDMLRKHTPVFTLISSRNNTKDEWVETGRVFERIALEAEREGVQTAISAVPLNPEALGLAFRTKFRPQIFFRMGYSNARPGHSPRLPPEEVTV